MCDVEFVVRLGALAIRSELEVGGGLNEMTGAVQAGGRCFPFMAYHYSLNI